MTDKLKLIYEAENKLRYYFDKTVPVDLYRGQNNKEAKGQFPLLYPNPGFTRADGFVRLPDVLIEIRDGQEIVRGCVATKGHYRGISTFDKKGRFGGFKWYILPAGTVIPEALAITQDTDYPNEPNHFTIAPKNDMPLALFNAWLKVLNLQMKPAD